MTFDAHMVITNDVMHCLDIDAEGQGMHAYCNITETVTVAVWQLTDGTFQVECYDCDTAADNIIWQCAVDSVATGVTMLNFIVSIQG